MKRSFLLIPAVVLALGAASTVAQAQEASQQGQPGQQGGQPGTPNRGMRRMQMLMEGITLTAEQQARVDSIIAAFRPQMPVVTPGERPDSATMARGRELTLRQDSTIRAVLTAEQQTVFDRNVETVRNMRNRRP